MKPRWRLGIAFGFCLLLGDFNYTFAQVNSYGPLPLSFEPNQGQADPRVKFLFRGSQHTVFLTPGEAVLVLSRGSGDGGTIRRSATGITEDGNKETRKAKLETVLRMKLVHANPKTEISGTEELRGKVNYFIGNDPKRWHSNLPTYAKVQYKEVYPGIDLVYHGSQGQLEYDFIVHPGADPSRIGLELRGADRPEVDADGDLLVHTILGTIRQRKPAIYQDVDGFRREVRGRYVLRDRHQVGFEVGRYDAALPLVIDPVLSYSTYLGGSGNDIGQGLAIDAAGNVFVAGYTASNNFPATTGSFQRALAGGFDAFVTKLNPAGSAVVYVTYLGGSGDDFGFSIGVDSQGSAYVTGQTSSANFPTTPGAFQVAGPGTSTSFVTKVSASGARLVYSSYVGSGGRCLALAVDSAGHAYLGCRSSMGSFPTTPGAFQSTCALPASVGTCAAVAEVDPAGSSLLYATYLGGGTVAASGDCCTEAVGIGVDGAGSAYVVGITSFTDFPTTGGVLQPAYGGGLSDGFVSMLNPAGSALVYSTYLGGSAYDQTTGIAVDGAGNAYVTGQTSSADFPTTPGSYQGAFAGPTGDFTGDAFVSKLNADGSALLYSTYLGGGSNDSGGRIAVDTSGNAYVTGGTGSANFPTVNAVQATFGGGLFDGFVTAVDPAGASLVFSSYLGGSGDDVGVGIALDSQPSPNAYVAGYTASSNFPATSGAFRTVFGGGPFDAFVAKIAPAARSTTTSVSCAPSTLPVGSSTTCTVTASDTDGSGAAAPTGTVTFTSDGGTLSPSSCGLAAIDTATSSCSVSDTPAVVGTRPVTASYGGDSTHAASGGTTMVTAPATSGPTSTSVSCNTSLFQLGLSTTCIATVTDTAGGPTPVGTANFTSDGSGTFSNPSCTLDASGQCPVTYTPDTTGTQTITAAYSGDSVHAGSSGGRTVTVTDAAAGETSGAGKIAVPGGRASFGFDVQRQNTGDAPDGALSYHNNPRGLTVQATQIRTFDIVDDTATLSGDCTKTYDGNTWIDCTFSVSVRDNDNPPQFVGGVESGRGWDSFTIQVSDEPTEGGTLLRGTIDNQ